jgi:hypothetical protein
MDQADDMFVKTNPARDKAITPGEKFRLDEYAKTLNRSIDDSLSRASVARRSTASQTFEIPAPPKAMGDIELPMRQDVLIEKGPKVPLAPSGDLDEITGRLAQLQDELAAARTLEAPDIDTSKLAGSVDDPDSFDAMMRSRNAVDESKSMLSGSGERKIQKLARAKGEAYGKAGKGVDTEAIAAARTGTKGTTRPVAEIEKEIALISKEAKSLPGLLRKYEKEMARYEVAADKYSVKVAKAQRAADKLHVENLAKYQKEKLKLTSSQLMEAEAYERSIKAIEDSIALKNKTVADLDDAVDVLKSRMSSYRKTTAGSEYERYAVAARSNHSVSAAEEVSNLRRLLGDDPKELSSFVKSAGDHASLSDSITARLRAPIPEGTLDARKAYEAATEELRASVGEPTAQAMHKLMNASPDEVITGFNAMAKYSESATDLARISGDKALIKSTADSMAELQRHLIESLPEQTVAAAKNVSVMEIVQAAGLVGLPSFEGTSLDEAGKVVLMLSLLKGRGAGKAAAKSGGALSKGMASAASAGASHSARSIVHGSGFVQSGLRGAAGMAGYKAFGGFLNKLGGARGLHQLNGRAGSQVVHAINRLAKKGGRQLMTGKSAAAVLRGIKFAEQADEDAKDNEQDLQALFKKRTDQIRRMAHNQEQMRMDVWKSTQELRELHPTWGDKTEVGIGNRLAYAMEKMPKDPGGHYMFGGSTWQPDDFQIQEYTNILEVIADPMSAVEGIMNRSLTPEAAEAFRATAPAMFNAVRNEIASRVDELSDMTYEEQNLLGTLLGVGVNATTQPGYAQFIASAYAERQAKQAESMGNVDANALMQGTPTQAQQLLNRGTK